MATSPNNGIKITSIYFLRQNIQIIQKSTGPAVRPRRWKCLPLLPRQTTQFRPECPGHHPGRRYKHLTYSE